MNYLITYMDAVWLLFNDMALYLMMGFLMAGILHFFIPPQIISRYLGGSSFASVCNASLLGVPLPLCSCGVIPAGLSLHKNGASPGATVSFLISTPQTGIDSIMITYAMMGWPFALLRPLIAFVTGIYGGMITNAMEKNRTAVITDTSNCSTQKTKEKTWKNIFRYAFGDLLQNIQLWLIAGILMAALIAVFVPDDFFSSLVNNEWESMLIVLVASVPFYICATSSVPVAAVLMMKGLSPGAALVFLMAGPATNIATIAVLTKTLGKRSAAAYLAAIISGALLFGCIINEVLPEQWFNISMQHHAHDHATSTLLQIAASLLLLLLLLYGIWIKYVLPAWKKFCNKQKPLQRKHTETITIRVSGMSCSNCKSRVESTLLSLPGIFSAVADIEAGIVLIEKDTAITMESIREIVEKAGYTANEEVHNTFIELGI